MSIRATADYEQYRADMRAVRDATDAYLHAHYTAQKQLRRERMWRVAGYVLAGMLAGYMLGSGLWLVTGAW